jgi:excinuclease UvrABC ATPase subunit
MSKRAADHDKFVGIMKSLAQAEDLQKKDKEKEEHKPAVEEKTCFTCERKKACKTFNGKMTVSGVYSMGGDMKVSTCEKWKERRNNPSDPKKIKSLLKQFCKVR